MSKKTTFRAKVWKKAKEETFGSSKTALFTVVFSVAVAFARLYVFGRNSAMNYFQEFLVDFVVTGLLFLVVLFIANLIFRAPYLVGDEQEEQIGQLSKKIGPPAIIDMKVRKEVYPFAPPTRKVGIIIRNQEAHDLTDIYIKMLRMVLIEHGDDYFEEPANLNIYADNRRFHLETDKVEARDEMVFYLAEIQEKSIAFLLEKKPYIPKYRYPLHQQGYVVHHLTCLLIFQIHGKILGNTFREETYSTQVTSTRIMPIEGSDKVNDPSYDSVSIDIGDVVHEQPEKANEKPKNNQS